jgi:two-component system, sensor histidine kinase
MLRKGTGVAMARSKTRQKSAARPARRRTRASGAARRAEKAVLPIFAHDIRTALTGILALGELLASSNLGDRERRWAAGIKDSAQHLASLTTLVIDAAKADIGSLTLQQDVFRPRRLIEALGETLIARAETKGLRAEVKVASDLPDVLVGDVVRLRAALENLIDNAVKFTAAGAVRLHVQPSRAARGRVKITFAVADSGIGLTPAETRRLFRPFVQANAEIARRYGGAGLGVAVVKTLAKLMGGDLKVTSTRGKGSTFRFTATLPVASGAAAESAQVQASAVAQRRLKILCAEDNPYGRVILNTILAELGHNADFVGSGEEAVAAISRGYDLVLMDVTLSGIDGLEATRRIRASSQATRTAPIIGISGRTEAGDAEAARIAGMNFYLRKPISPSALNEAIMAVLPGAK